MNSPPQHGWTRISTPAGRYEYQFHGSLPTVRNAKYEDATDYVFLLMNTEGWLYRIPVRVAQEAEHELRKANLEVLALAEDQLRAGLAEFTPRSNAPYDEMDHTFAVDAARARDFISRQGQS